MLFDCGAVGCVIVIVKTQGGSLSSMRAYGKHVQVKRISTTYREYEMLIF